MSGVNETKSAEKLLLGAVIVSLLLHLLAFSLWRVGQAQGWWRNMAVPHWMQVVSNALMPMTPKKAALDIPPQTQLAFVDVDPALATPQPPKKPMFQGARNTVAANREIKVPSDMPNIDGRQQDFLKTTENAKPTPANSSAPSQPQPQKEAPQSAPKQAHTPGDLAMVRPSETASDQAQPQPQPYQRPRTVAEARAKNGVPGQKSRQVGGVQVGSDIAFDVQGTPLGDYIARMVDAVRTQWYKLLENRTADVTGKVVLRFRLHSDGRISGLTREQNEVSELLATLCEQAVSDPAPFEKWPREMRLALPNDYDDITFTFFYEPY